MRELSALKALIQSDEPLRAEEKEPDLPKGEIRLVHGSKNLYADTTGGIWRLRENHWRRLGQALDSAGYSFVRLPKRTVHGTKGNMRVSVHRLVLLAWQGPPPLGHVGMHLNDVKTDNRTENLRWGTVAENNAMAVGKPKSEQLQDGEVDFIRALRAAGYTYREISEKTGVRRNLIQSICTGRAYKRLTRDKSHGPVNHKTLKCYLLRPKLEPFVRNDILGLWNHVTSPVLVMARNEGLAREIASGQAAFPYHSCAGSMLDPWLSTAMSDCIEIENTKGERLVTEHFIGYESICGSKMAI